MKPRVLVLRAAGSNCDQETAFAFDQAGGSSDLVHINRLLDGQVLLSDFQILAIPGGFTYGDDISAGKVYANQLRFQLAEQLQRFYDQDKLIIGICNGFQVLVKAGLLPKVDMKGDQSVTLTNNDAGRYDDRWIYLRVNDSPCVFTRAIKEIVHFPMAHAEGKFMPANEAVLNELRRNRQIVFQYVQPDGAKAEYPWNPNGSTDDIAGLCDPSGRVLGLMPHPERNIDPTHHPRWTAIGLDRIADGLAIFKNAISYFS
jgi:phosphoribosylformylglycinamidine synthase subunit PurQ / glutaminase